MKRTKIPGIILILLAIVMLAVGVAADLAKDGSGGFANMLASARESAAAVDSAAKAAKNVSTIDKKIKTARGSLTSAQDACAEAGDALALLDEAQEGGTLGDEELDALDRALEQLKSGTDDVRSAAAEASGAIASLESGVTEIETLADTKLLKKYRDTVSDAYDAVSGAEGAVDTVRESAAKALKTLGLSDEAIQAVSMTEEPDPQTVEDCHAAISSLSARAEELSAYGDTMDDWAQQAKDAVQAASTRRLTPGERVTILLADNFVGVLFTAVLLLALGVVLLFFAKPFAEQWRKNPVFSVGMALIVMLILQSYALGFGQGSIGAWAKFWFDNTFNVLRANSSVGMIALGMTLVIITGGIDLAVGSTLAGVGTVLMTLIDTGDHGVLVKLGLTGAPAFIVGILGALLTGLAVGAVIGLLVTKGRVPPFIVTLGVMNVVRSVSQYFTKSYTPTVPKSFEAIANTVIGGQRPMTILYWLVLAVIFYLVMKHTVFGRYVYAVGSNERTTRLSGINTNRVKLRVYMISGLVVAIAAVAQLSRLGGMDVASAGSGYELDAIAAVVVGGTAMSGGRGSIVGTVLGVLIIGIMNNLLILLGVDAFLTDAFKGAIVVAAVLMQRKERNA